MEKGRFLSLEDLWTKPEQSGPDICPRTSPLTLLKERIIEFFLDTAGRRNVIDTSQLNCIIYNPNRDTITFSMNNPNSSESPTFATYIRSKIVITKVKATEHPAVKAAERILRDKYT